MPNVYTDVLESAECSTAKYTVKHYGVCDVFTTSEVFS